MYLGQKIIIIGGGLAGLTAAIHLSLKGCKVSVIEKNSYPKHRVCGEYISNEVLYYLRQLGVQPLKKGAKEITKFEFTGLTGKSLNVELPLGGFGMSRYTLDLLLYQRALSVGVNVIKDSVTAIDFRNELFTVTTKKYQHKSAYVIGAYGKRSGLDSTLSRNFIKTHSPWLGVKMHYEANFPEDLVALHHFNGGYCGLSKVETGAVNVCYLTDYTSFKKYKNLAEFQEKVLEKNRNLKVFFANAKPLFKKPLTISQISFQNKSTIENHILMIGDSAGLIHPLCGNGMAMAIHSAKIASQSLLLHLQNKTSRQELEIDYIKQWKKTFTKRIRNGSLIQKGLYNKTLTKVGVRVLQKSPKLLKKMISSTHGKILSDEF